MPQSYGRYKVCEKTLTVELNYKNHQIVSDTHYLSFRQV